jgi:gluconolactonase
VLGRGTRAQTTPAPNAQLGTPPSTITNPPRDWSAGHPSIYPDPDVLVVDPPFRALAPGNSAVRRLWTGAQWAEGPAWSSQGQYLVFSDVTGNTLGRFRPEGVLTNAAPSSGFGR